MPASERQQKTVAARRLRALQLRAAGATYQQIADQCGHKTASAAVQDVTRALAGIRRQLDAQAHVNLTLELVRLDDLERAAQVILRQAASADPALALRTIDRLERIGRRRAELLGLTARARGGRDDGRREPDHLDEVAERRRRRRSRYAAHG